MANYQIKLVLRPELILRSSCYPKSKVTQCRQYRLQQTAHYRRVYKPSGADWDLTAARDALYWQPNRKYKHHSYSMFRLYLYKPKTRLVKTVFFSQGHFCWQHILPLDQFSGFCSGPGSQQSQWPVHRCQPYQHRDLQIGWLCCVNREYFTEIPVTQSVNHMDLFGRRRTNESLSVVWYVSAVKKVCLNPLQGRGVSWLHFAIQV